MRWKAIEVVGWSATEVQDQSQHNYLTSWSIRHTITSPLPCCRQRYIILPNEFLLFIWSLKSTTNLLGKVVILSSNLRKLSPRTTRTKSSISWPHSYNFREAISQAASDHVQAKPAIHLSFVALARYSAQILTDFSMRSKVGNATRVNYSALPRWKTVILSFEPLAQAGSSFATTSRPSEG